MRNLNGECKMSSAESCRNEPQYPINCREEKVVSRLRINLSQCLACSAVNLFKFSNTLFGGFTTLILGELYKENAEIKLTIDQLSWYASSCFAVPVGSLLAGLISHRIGNRRTLLFTTAIHTLCWIQYYYVTDVVWLLIIQSLVGLTNPVAFIPGASYVTEVTQPHLRSILLASGNLHMLCGNFFTILLGTVMYWRTVALVNLGCSIITFIAMYFIPESPYWLASKGKIDEAEKSMSWLRGWTTPDTIKDELSMLKHKNQNESIQERNSQSKSKLKDKFKLYLQRSFTAPFLIMAYTFGVMHPLTGSLVLCTYTITTFNMLQSPVDDKVSTLIFDGLRIVSAIGCIFIIQFTGKRKLMFTSMIIAGLCYFTIATFHTLVKQQTLSGMYIWVPTIALQVATFSTSGGIDKIVYMYNAELFPSEFRCIGSGTVYFVRSIVNAVINKSFLYVVNAITLQGVFIFFGIVNVVGFVTSYLLLPETNGKTLIEIENYFTDSKQIKNEKRKSTSTAFKN